MNPPGSLDLDEEQVDGVLCPGELQALPIQRSVLDLRPREVELADPILVDPPAARRPVRLCAANEIRRDAIEWGVARQRRARSLYLRLVIASRECPAIADADPIEI